MENQFLIDSEYLSAEALEKKHRLETDPSSRKSHMEYMPGMEQITSDVMEKVMSQRILCESAQRDGGRSCHGL